MDAPTASLIVPTFQRASTLERTLTALCDLDYPADRLEIIVVDDGSKDSTALTVSRFRPVRYVQQPNSGVAKARNTGARLATGELLLFVDDDIVVPADNLHRHLALHDEYGACIVAGHSEFAPEVRATLRLSAFGRFRLWAEDVSKRDYAKRWGSTGRIRPTDVATQNLSISRRLFWELGGFDERFPVGAEDQDLCWRARSAGCTIIHDYDIRVIHNDQHHDLMALCKREERGAIGLVCFARKHSDFPTPPTLLLNGPLRRSDPPRVLIRKVVRTTLSQPALLWVGHKAIKTIETLRPSGGRPLNFLYRALTGLYVFRGVRRGYRATSTDPWRLTHKAT